MSMCRWLLACVLPAAVEAHGAITTPAMRQNYHVSAGYCPWCQGDQMRCASSAHEDVTSCVPPSPCWGAEPSTTVSPDKWGNKAHLKHPDGSYWVDPTGGTQERPLWCPGDELTIRYYLNGDHNGVFQWESQVAAPGDEVEDNFKNITLRMSVNNYNRKISRPDGTTQNIPLTNYFSMSGDLIAPGFCKDGVVWTNTTSHCLDDVFAETTLHLPELMPVGETVMRWRWFGGANEEGMLVSRWDQAPEKSMFLNCKDVIIGTAEACAARGSFSLV